MKKTIKNMLSVILTVLLLLGTGVLQGCGDSNSSESQNKVVKIGITTPDDKIWDAVKKKAKEDYDITVETICFSNVNINQVLADGEVDLNAFQHYAYFNKNKEDLKLNLVSLGDMYILRLDIYSNKYKSLAELPDGAQIAVPNDPVNIGRSLKVFEEAGLIKLKDNSNNTPTTKDISENPKNIKLVEIEHSQIVRSLNDVDAGIVFVKDAADAGLNPKEDPIYVNNVDINDSSVKDYINLIAAREEDKDNETYKNVVKAFHSKEVAKAIEEQFEGAAIPAFE